MEHIEGILKFIVESLTLKIWIYIILFIALLYVIGLLIK